MGLDQSFFRSRCTIKTRSPSAVVDTSVTPTRLSNSWASRPFASTTYISSPSPTCKERKSVTTDADQEMKVAG